MDHSPVRAARRALLPCLAALLPAVPLATQPPAVEFHAGDVGALSCTAQPLGAPKGTLVVLRVTVHNRSEYFAEPQVFEVTAPGRGKDAFSTTVPRTPEPRLRRYGRSVPPGGSLTYVLQFSRWKAKAARYRVEVASALFHGGPALPEPHLEIGRPRRDEFEADGRRFPLTRCTVENPTDQALDLWFLGSFTEPVEAKALVPLHLEPRERKEWEIREWRPAMHDASGSTQGVAVTALELVDWTTVLPDTEQRGRALFVEAWDHWVRWPDGHPALRGRLHWQREGRTNIVSETPATASGTFEIGAGPAVITLDDGVPPALKGDVARDLERAFADLRRPGAEQLLQHNEVEQLDAEWVCLKGRGLDLTHWTRGNPVAENRFSIHDGTLVGHKQYANNPTVTWHLQLEPEGFLVSEREGLLFGLERERRTYDRLDGAFVPVSLVIDFDDHSGAVGQRQLLLSGMSTVATGEAGAGQQAPPSGDGVEGLASAWGQTYRYPGEPVTLRAHFEYRNPGTGLEWQGQRKLTGEIALFGFRGFLHGERGWERAEVRFDQKLADFQKDALGDLLQARLGMWGSRDLVGRRPFAEVFAGATIDADATGEVFRIAGDSSEYDSIGVSAGLVRWLQPRRGPRFEYRHQKIGETWVPVRIEVGRAELTARWSRAADGWLVPVDVTLTRVLGDEFGTEKWKLTRVRVE